MRSLSLVMSECSLSGRGQVHASNFYIVDLENFATASRRYTGDRPIGLGIHNSTVVGLDGECKFIKTKHYSDYRNMFLAATFPGLPKIGPNRYT